MACACEAALRPSSTREGRGDRSEAEGAARLGRREAAVLCGAGWDSKGQPRGRRRRRKHRREGAKRATEERNERTTASRLGLWRCSPSIHSQSFISERLGFGEFHTGLC
ncbi:hypothetical protein EXE46_16050 [Halorubrum sp. GN11_10-6_MGM]|nr:hypothetical protein EXE46_16050 [Halorubrum sp. GN11_10-6_MGM]